MNQRVMELLDEIEDEYYRWARGLDTAGNSAAMHFEEHWDALLKRRDRPTEERIAVARESLGFTLRYLWEEDRPTWQAFLNRLETAAPREAQAAATGG
jgi:hypothetical protein